MKKRFQTKKRKKGYIKYFVYLFIIYLSYQIIMNYFNNANLVTNNEDFIKALMTNSNYHMKYEKSSKNLVSILTRFITNFDINKPLTVLEKNIVFRDKTKTKTTINNSDNNVPVEELEKISKHINDPYSIKVENPRIYIYNSHQLENYSNKNLEIYNITPNVMMASYLLKDKLNKLSIPTIVEDSNFIEFMKINNWSHKDIYKASRFYVIDAINKHKDLDLIIDLHRDALTHAVSTTTINGKKYAKVLFVVGIENPGYNANLKLVNKINNLIEKKYPTLSRGVLTKKGTGVDGVYNQDLSPKIILLEVGGQHNTIEEVLNTVDAISVVIKEIIGDN
ncbi:MAG: stage II sporulation protein P [Bacilli bacterium]|nr:stage II sporulation protein P [Bacilli bacterium]